MRSEKNKQGGKTGGEWGFRSCPTERDVSFDAPCFLLLSLCPFLVRSFNPLAAISPAVVRFFFAAFGLCLALLSESC